MKVNVLDVFSKITDNCKQGDNVSIYWGNYRWARSCQRSSAPWPDSPSPSGQLALCHGARILPV